MLVQVGDCSTLSDDVVVWFEGQLQLLMALVKGEDNVKSGESMYAV